jgi:small-conductance mechanosensitive channel
MIEVWVTLGATALLMLVLGVILLTGKGANLIAGFNTMPKEEKEKYDKAALCKFIGKLLLVTAALILLMGAGIQLGYETQAALAGTGVMTAVIIAAVIYANTGNRFKKKD